MRKYYEIAKKLPEDLSYEELERIAKEHNLNAVILFLIHNDFLIRKERADVFRELVEDEWYDYDYENIEDLI